MNHVSTSDLTDLFNVTPQRISAIVKEVGIEDSEIGKAGREKEFSPYAMRKILSYRGYKFDTQETMAFCNNKGGEGKTSIAINTALRLSNLGYSVLLIDGDPQGNATSYFLSGSEYKSVLFDVVQENVSIEEAIIEVGQNLAILPSSLTNERLSNELQAKKINHQTFFKKLLSPLDYNFIIWDLSPSLSMTNYLALLSCDRINIITSLSPFGVQGVEMTHNLIMEAQANFKDYSPFVDVLINKFDLRQQSSLTHMSELQELQKERKFYLSPVVIRTDISIAKAQGERSTIKQNTNAFRDISDFVESIVELKRKIINS